MSEEQQPDGCQLPAVHTGQHEHTHAQMKPPAATTGWVTTASRVGRVDASNRAGSGRWNSGHLQGRLKKTTDRFHKALFVLVRSGRRNYSTRSQRITVTNYHPAGRLKYHTLEFIDDIILIFFCSSRVDFFVDALILSERMNAVTSQVNLHLNNPLALAD
ncbi:hypothetical protein PGTUg99_007156, partial [Puccinia graminis f. sp. tritici]